MSDYLIMVEEHEQEIKTFQRRQAEAGGLVAEESVDLPE